MKVISGIYWDRGKRDFNQDSLLLQQAMTSRGRMLLAVVSDGIGGLEEGEKASGYIAEMLAENFYRHVVPVMGRGKGKNGLRRNFLRCFYEINEALKAYGRERDLKLGATVSLVFVWRKNYGIFHLGDSRIYLFRRGRIRMLTRDHSDDGRGLTKCLGSFPFQAPDIQFGRLGRRSGFLLCTDGFYRMLGLSELEILLPGEIDLEEQIERRLRELAGAALKKGEADNMSAVYLRFG